MSGGAIIAAAAASHHRRIQAVYDRFRVAGATAPERAQTLETLGLASVAEVSQLTRAGLLQEAAPGAWYLDERALIARRDAVSPRLRIVIGILLVVLIALAVFLVGILMKSSAPT